MDLKLFSEVFSLRRKPEHETSHHEPEHHGHDTDDDIDAFHHHLNKLHEVAARLHKSGHYVEVDYNGQHAVRHDDKRRTGTIFFNQAHKVEHKVQISKKVPLRPFDKA